MGRNGHRDSARKGAIRIAQGILCKDLDRRRDDLADDCSVGLNEEAKHRRSVAAVVAARRVQSRPPRGGATPAPAGAAAASAAPAPPAPPTAAAYRRWNSGRLVDDTEQR